MDRIEDRAWITDQMFRYARATDWLETADHRLVVVDECLFATPHSGDLHSVSAVVEFMNHALPRFEATQHVISNTWIEFTGAEAANAVSYFRAWHRYPDPGTPDLILWGEYRDRRVLLDGSWRIRERRSSKPVSIRGVTVSCPPRGDSSLEGRSRHTQK